MTYCHVFMCLGIHALLHNPPPRFLLHSITHFPNPLKVKQVRTGVTMVKRLLP